jgi:ATP-binding cassette subfamily B protein
LATIKLTVWRIQFRALTNKHDNDFHGKATDSLQNFETVKFFSAERFETERYTGAVRKYQVWSTSAGVLSCVVFSKIVSRNLKIYMCICAKHY